MSNKSSKKNIIPCIILLEDGYFNFNLQNFESLNKSTISLCLNSPSIYPYLSKKQLQNQRQQIINDHSILQIITSKTDQTRNVKSYVLKKQ